MASCESLITVSVGSAKLIVLRNNSAAFGQTGELLNLLGSDDMSADLSSTHRLRHLSLLHRSSRTEILSRRVAPCSHLSLRHPAASLGTHAQRRSEEGVDDTAICLRVAIRNEERIVGYRLNLAQLRAFAILSFP